MNRDNFHCAKCGCRVFIGQVIGKTIRDRKVYCLKCAEVIKGERDETGYKSPDLPTNKILVEGG